MTLTVHAAARTHIGSVRRRNEDAYYSGEALFAVADGLGGHVGGDVASRTAIDALKPYDQRVEPADLVAVLAHGVHAANNAIRAHIEANPGLDSMGTTLVALLRSDATAALANVGDSRAYLLRHDGDATPQLTQITEDHNYRHLIAEATQDLTLQERIARYLDGRRDGRSPDVTIRDLRPGDRYLLCSDGLSGVVPSDLVRDALATGTSDEAADRLTALALDRGGPDNITLIVIEVTGRLQ